MKSLEILFASNNTHKVDEMRMLLPPGISLIGLTDIHWTEEIPEPYFSYEENAKSKAGFVFERTGLSCFADDSGLEVDALDGRPGVFSARYGGPSRNSIENMNKVLSEIKGSLHRQARFYSIIAFLDAQKEMHLFKGVVEGTIAQQPQGNGGFGYDPIFIPDGFDKTFGELTAIIKSRISHRSKAIEKFIGFLSNAK